MNKLLLESTSLTVKYRKGMKLVSIDQLVTKINLNNSGALDLRKIRKLLTADSSHYTETEVNLSDLIGADDKDVNANYADPRKGAIIVTDIGYIVDGRHRAALAKRQHKKTIMALVPVVK